MKDAKGHGSEKRGGADPANYHQHKIAVDTVRNPMKGLFLGGPSAAEAESMLRSKFGYGDADIAKLTGGGTHTAAGINPRGDVVPVTVTNAQAAAALAQGGAKSEPVPVHPAQVGQMKMSPGDFASLRAAVTPHLASTADPSHSSMRQRWDAMHKSGFDTRPLYKAGLNDNHIDTALRRIQGR